MTRLAPTRHARSLALLLLAPLGSCSKPLSGPPELRLGRDECAECGMLIAEDRCSCALLIDDQGAPRHALFDDVGCLLDYRMKDSAPPVLEAYVHDHQSRAWVPAESAWFVQHDPGAVRTPMGTGLIAFAAESDARAAAQLSAGVVLDYPGVFAARRDRALRPGSP